MPPSLIHAVAGMKGEADIQLLKRYEFGNTHKICLSPCFFPDFVSRRLPPCCRLLILHSLQSSLLSPISTHVTQVPLPAAALFSTPTSAVSLLLRAVSRVSGFHRPSPVIQRLFHAMICGRPFHTSCLLLIIISLISRVTADRPQVQCKRPQPFDRLLLALQWPPGVCYQNIHKTCIVNTGQFLIHGTWPSNASGASPEFCCSDRFRKEEIKSFEPALSVSAMSFPFYNHHTLIDDTALCNNCAVDFNPFLLQKKNEKNKRIHIEPVVV